MLLPYTDSDVQQVMLRLIEDPAVSPILAQFYPDLEVLRRAVTGLHTIADFQREIMVPRVDAIIADTMTEFTCSLSPKIDPDQRYLFISNHRDIILDAMLLDWLFIRNHIETPRVIFGSNLLTIPLMAEVGRLNKLVSMDRGGSPRDFYQVLATTSRYIRQSIVDDRQSVWIAQRNGRTKDGNDRTDPAVIKMLALSASKDDNSQLSTLNPQLSTLSSQLSTLNIVPVAISYEWEPCDLLKVREICAPQPYVKRPDDDFTSVVTGITQPKGNVHLTVDDPLTAAELAACHDDPQQVAELIDRRIHAAYRLHPTNKDASLLRDRLAHLNTEQEKEALIKLYLTPANSATKQS